MEKPELHFLRRVGAFYIDMIIVAVTMGIIGTLWQTSLRFNISYAGLLLGPVFTSITLYFWSTTPGKKITKLEVVNTTSNPGSLIRYFAREFCRWLPFLIVPFYVLVSSMLHLATAPEQVGSIHQSSYFHYGLSKDPFNIWGLVLSTTPMLACILYTLNIFNPPMFYDRWFGFKVVTKEPSEIKTVS